MPFTINQTTVSGGQLNPAVQKDPHCMYAAGEVLCAPVTEATIGDHHTQLAGLTRGPSLHAGLEPAARTDLNHQPWQQQQHHRQDKQQ